MKYILLFFFTLNTMLPISGYADFLMFESKTPVVKDNVVSSPAHQKCHDRLNMDSDCDMNCFTHCPASIAMLSSFFRYNVEATKSSKIITTFKYFYLHTLSPELPPPLI